MEQAGQLTGYEGRQFDFRVWWVRDYPEGTSVSNLFRYITKREVWNPTGGMKGGSTSSG